MKLFLGNEEANLTIILLSIIMKMFFFFTSEGYLPVFLKSL